MALFADQEYRRRIEITRRKMDESRIDVLVVSDPANMNYLTGYDGWSFYTPQAVVVSRESDTPLWIGRGWTPTVPNTPPFCLRMPSSAIPTTMCSHRFGIP
jgi:Xaa-Pro aminopeptidase